MQCIVRATYKSYMHIVAIQVQEQGAEAKCQEPKWKLRWAHSDQGMCWNIAPLNFQRNDAKPTPFLSAPLNNVRQKKCPPQVLKAFLLPP